MFNNPSHINCPKKLKNEFSDHSRSFPVCVFSVVMMFIVSNVRSNVVVFALTIACFKLIWTSQSQRKCVERAGGKIEGFEDDS